MATVHTYVRRGGFYSVEYTPLTAPRSLALGISQTASLG